MKKQLKGEIFGEDVIFENFKKCFDLAITALIRPKTSIAMELITKEVVKAIFYVKGSQRVIAKCLEQAIKIRERDKRFWPFPLTFRWVVPSLSAARALHRILERFRKVAENSDQIVHDIYVWNDVGSYGRDELCRAEAVAENGAGEPNIMVLRDLDGNELRRIPLYTRYSSATYHSRFKRSQSFRGGYTQLREGQAHA